MTEPQPPVRASTWEWLRAGLLGANLAWTTLCLGGVLSGTLVVTSVLLALLMAVHFLEPGAGVRAHPAGLLFLPFLAYAAANVAWISPVPWLGWVDWLNWAQAVAVFWIVLNGIGSPSCGRFLGALLVGLGVAAAAMAVYQHVWDPRWLMLGRKQVGQYVGRAAGCFGNPNAFGAFMALLIPPVGALALGGRAAPVRRALWLAALAALSTGFVLAVSRGAWFALVAAIALRPLLIRDRSLARRIGAAAAGLAVAAAAGAALYYSYPLMRERVNSLVADAGERSRPIVWKAAMGIAESHPVFGSGGGSFDTMFEAYRPAGFTNQPFFAHCDYLNTLCDYGSVGFLLLFGAAAVVAWRCARARGLEGAAYVGLVAFALHLLVDFNLKYPALATAFALVAALVTRVAWPEERSGVRMPRPLGWICAFAPLPLLVLWIIPVYRAEGIRYFARAEIDKMGERIADMTKEGSVVASARAELARAVVLDPRNAKAWSDKAYVDSLWSLVKPGATNRLGADVTAEADRAVAICPVSAEFWIRKGTGLDMQGKWVQGGECYARALRLAPNRADCWYYEGYHMSLNHNETAFAMAATDACLRLDPGFLLAQSLRQQLERRSP
jgi:tetratricopeptide (TPR) repeat protein